MKRFLDIVASMGGLIFLFPLFILIALLIKLESNGSVFFCQKRVGINDGEFMMYKFRSMKVGTPEVATDKLTNSQSYITRIGYYLRKYSLDELPQLFNILIGHMSIVGPRPALYNQYDLRKRRVELGISQIRPGLTGWAQINGRDEISLEEKIELDLYYVNNQSIVFDFRIIFHTLFSVYVGNGVTAKR